MADGFVFYHYRTGYPPYRRTPAGRLEQYHPEHGGWVPCKQNDSGLKRISPGCLPKDARADARAPAADDERADVIAERDQLQARIDAALAVLDEPPPATPYGANALWKVQNHRAVQVQLVRAALLDDQPAAPTSRDTPEADQ